MNNDYPVQTPIKDMVKDSVNKTEAAVEKSEEWKLPLKFKILFPIIQLLPVAFVLLSFSSFRIPEFKWYTFLLIILALVPTIAVYFFLMTKSKNKRRRAIAIILCILYLPLSFILSVGAFPHSRTTAKRHYREFDHKITDTMIYRLFPERYGEDFTIDEYYYYYTVGSSHACYDIYAERNLSKHELDAELKRIKEIREDAPTIRYGNFECVILQPHYSEEYVFDKDNGVYGKVIMFAYNKQSGCVRYIASHLEYMNTRYYQQLDWE